MVQNEITELGELKLIYPKLKTIALIGRGGVGKTKIAKEVAGRLNPKGYYPFDDGFTEFYKRKPDDTYDILKVYPDLENLLLFHLHNAHNNKEQFTDLLFEVRKLSERLLCQKYVQNQLNKNQGVTPDAWVGSLQNDEPTIAENVLIIDSFTPGRQVLEQVDKIYKITTPTKKMAQQAFIERIIKLMGDDTPENRKLLWNIIQMADRVVDDTLSDDLQGLQFMQYPNDHRKGLAAASNIATNIVNDYYQLRAKEIV